MKDVNFNLLRDKAYEIAKNNGFHDEYCSDEHLLVLVISELMEALEAYRKGNCLYENEDKYMDVQSKINDCYNNSEFKECFEEYIKDTFEDELADTVIRLLDTAGSNNINIDLYPVKSSIYKNKIPEYFYEVIKNMMYSYSWGQIINYTIKYILDLCKILAIDIAWHIKFKMNYNRLREYKHGKRF